MLSLHAIVEGTMYAVIRRSKPGDQKISDEEVIQLIDAELVPLLGRIRGFVSYDVVDTGDRTLTSVSVFETREGASESTRVVREFIAKQRDRVGSVSLDVSEGEVRVHKTAEHAVGAGR